MIVRIDQQFHNGNDEEEYFFWAVLFIAFKLCSHDFFCSLSWLSFEIHLFSLRPDYAAGFRAWLPEEPLESSETPESEVSVSRQKEDESGTGAMTKMMATLEEPTTLRRRISFTSVC